MKSLIHEIHRRSLWQVLGIYLAASWIALQVVETLAESMTLPDWVQGFAVILLVVGLPVVLATAFVQEGVGRRPVAQTQVSMPPSQEPAAGPVAIPGTRPAGWGLFTWRRALLGGVGAFVLLALALGGWVVLRSLGIGPAGTLVAKGVLEERATLVLTDFSAEDASLSRAATEAFRVDLDQSSVIDLADPGFVAAVLTRMERDAEAPLDLATGRELAVREGMPAVIAGEVTRAGTGYVLTAQLLTPDGGEVLVSGRETAADDSELISAIDRLSKKLRERIGESLGDLAGGPALESVTTGDLEALRLYSQAVKASDTGQSQLGADLLEEAVALDTSFAMAWRKLGMIHVSGNGALGNFTRGVEALGRAYTFRDRLTERERGLATAGYYSYVDRDDRRAADAYERMLDRDPEDAWALNNLALIVGGDFGDYEQAEDLLLRSIALDTLSTTHHWNLSVVQSRLGKYDEAAGTLEAWRRRIPNDPMSLQFSAFLAGASRDFEEAERYARESRQVRPGNRLDEGASYRLLSLIAATRGRVGEAVELSGRAEEAAIAAQGVGRALRDALDPAWISLATKGLPTEAAGLLGDALARYPLDEMGPLDPPWGQLVELSARTGSVDQARELIARWEAADPQAAPYPRHGRALGWIALEDGDIEGALRILDGTEEYACAECVPAAKAAAWSRAGDADSTISYLERYVDANNMFRMAQDATVLGGSLERLGELYDEKGDLDNAAIYYAQFVELWADADEELQPRVRVAQARLEEILRERG